MHRSVIYAGAFVGVLLAFLFGSSVIAWRAGQPLDPGPMLFGWWYDPTLIWRWWNAWGHLPEYRSIYARAGWLVLAIAAAPLALLRIIEVNTDLKPGIDPGRRDGFGRARQLLKTGHIARSGDGVVIGKDGRHVLRDNGDGHILIMGPSRLGKGTGHVVPTLLSHTGAMLVFDPKYELAAITGRFRRTLGPVHVVDPTDPRASGFNPLDDIRLDRHLIGDCQRVATILTPEAPSGTQDAGFWDNTARQLLTALLVHVMLSDDRTLAHLWQRVLDVKAKRYPITTNPFVRDWMRGHRELEGRVRDSINVTMVTHLGFLADPLIQQTTAKSDFMASDLMCSERPATVYVTIPVSDSQRLRPLTRVMIESIVSTLTGAQGHTMDGRVKVRPVLALIDEFPQLGKLDVVEGKMPIMAGFGVRLALVCQDEDQIRRLYGQHQAITANCSTICAIAGFSGTSLQTLERWGGKHSVRQRSKQLPGGISGSASVSQSETRMQLLEGGEMLQRASREVLVFTHGVAPCWLPKVRYYQEREYRDRFDPHSGGNAGSGPLKTEPTSGPAQPRYSDAADPDLALDDQDQELVDNVEDLVAQLPDAAQQAVIRRLRNA